MKVITEERLRELICSGEFSNFNRERNLLVTLLNHAEEIDTLTPKETDLILAAENYAEAYFDDDRQDIKIDVINAFMRGAEWGKRNK